MQTVNLVQGSKEWHAHRAKYFNASDAPAMMGVSKYKSRDQLLHEMATGLTKEVDAGTQKLFDDGHRFEALARPLAENIIGDELSPTVGVEGKYSASFDGITFDGSVIFEHKTLNEELREYFNTAKILPLMYRVQMEQQLMVSGAEKCLFMASKWNGDELVTELHVWYYPDAELRAQIIAGWAQFEIDLANYVPPVSQAMPQAEVIMSLPSLVINARAEITASNMAEYGEALKIRLQEVRSIVLITDQDFSNAKEHAKHLRDGIAQAKQGLDAMTAQNTSFDEAKRMVESWIEDMRQTALKLEKDIDAEDKKKKLKMIEDAKDKYQKHLEDLAEGTHPIRIPNHNPDFAGAIKNKKSYDSMQSSVNDLLAKVKAEANQIDMDIRAKQTWFKQFDEYANLFPDMQTIIFKATDDFKLLVESRIATQKAKDLAVKEKAEAEAKEKLAQAQQAINEAKPQVVEREAVTLSSQDQVDQSKSSLTLFDTQFSQVFQPSADDIVSAVAMAWNVDKATAHKWLVETDFVMLMVA